MISILYNKLLLHQVLGASSTGSICKVESENVYHYISVAYMIVYHYIAVAYMIVYHYIAVAYMIVYY